MLLLLQRNPCLLAWREAGGEKKRGALGRGQPGAPVPVGGGEQFMGLIGKIVRVKAAFCSDTHLVILSDGSPSWTPNLGDTPNPPGSTSPPRSAHPRLRV